MAGAWGLTNFVMSTSPADFNEFLDGACPRLSGLRRIDS
jgi:hypothetical protein